jgi:TRAP-type C4-dicarboxylate transport system substrate-binding protein
MNKEKWNSLPPDIQAIINKLNEEWVTEKITKKWATWQSMGKTGLEKKGNKISVLSPQENARWVEKVRPLLDDYVKMTKAKGLPGDQALKFCQDYLKANDR